MDAEELQQIIGELPGWLQIIILLIVAVVGVLFGKKVKTSGRVSTPKTFEESPGQKGKDATVDLTAAEIRNLKISYEPRIDHDPDPGEVVWTWVPFVENDGRGKDRPVLIIGRVDAKTVAGCYLSTKEHRGFIEVGPGKWDSKGRTSYLSPERVLRVTHNGMRREGATMSEKTFRRVTAELAKVLPITL